MHKILHLSAKIWSSAFLLLCITLLSEDSSAQQFFKYTQYTNNLTTINHAYSLLGNSGFVSGLYRKQWVGVEGAPSTFIFSSAFPLPKINAATGLTIADQQFAVEHQTAINAYFAKSIQLADKGNLAVSINAGLLRYTADYSTLDPSDPAFRNSDIRQTRPSMGFGVLYYTNKFYLGISVPEINVRSIGNGSVEGNSYFRNHYYFSGAYLFGEDNNDIRVKLATLFAYTKEVTTVANFSSTFYIKEVLGLGINYGTDKQMAGILSVNFKQVRIGYSYQFNAPSNNSTKFNLSTNEVMFTYRFGQNSTKTNLF